MTAAAQSLKYEHGSGIESEFHKAIMRRPTMPVVALVSVAWLFVSVSAMASWGRATTWELLVIVWLAGLSWFVAGMTVWLRRPGTAFGPLMVLVGFVGFNFTFLPNGSEWVALYSVLSENLSIALIVLLILSYPTGRIERSYERWGAAAVIGYVLVYPVLDTLALPYAYLWFTCNVCEEPVGVYNPLSTLESPDLSHLIMNAIHIMTPSMFLFAFGLVVVRFVRATSAARKALAPIWIASALAALSVVVHRGESGDFVFGTFFGDQASTFDHILLIAMEPVLVALIPLAFLGGIFQVGRLRGPVGQLVDDLESVPEAGALERRIARALGDPTARVYYRIEGAEAYTDSFGNPVGADWLAAQASTPLEHRGTALGVLVHDPGLLAQPELVHSVCAAASLALANERLRAEVQAHLAEVESSRTRIVQAADAERRRIERNLHDGAQQRLVALRLGLRLNAQQLRARDETAAEQFERSARELDEAIAELRELAHGIHPAILTDEGLTAATEVLLERTRLLADFRNSLPSRPPPTVEAAAYYVVAEALSNVAKHANASMLRLNLEHEEGMLVVSIVDNGVGGADMKRGSGLEGLSDRVAAVGGRLEVTSPSHGGTTIRATFPWEEP